MGKALRRIYVMLSIAALVLPLVCDARQAGSAGPSDLAICSPGISFISATLVCKEALTESERADIAAALANQRQYVAASEHAVIVGTRVAPENFAFGDRPYMCCDVKAYLEPIGHNIFATKLRSSFINRANFDLNFLNVDDLMQGGLRYKGSSAFVNAAQKVDTAVISRAGHQISTFTAEDNLVGAREVTTVTGANCINKMRACKLVLMPDGEGLAQLATSSVENEVDLSHFVLVGIHNKKPLVSNDRIEDLLFGYDKSKYENFMRFAFEVILPRVSEGRKISSIYTAGYSNSGAWALDALVERPHLVNGAIVMSAGSWELRRTPRLGRHQVFIGAGLFETGTRRQTVSIVEQLKSLGAQVTSSYPPSGHSMNSWVNIWIDALKSIGKRVN